MTLAALFMAAALGSDEAAGDVTIRRDRDERGVLRLEAEYVNGVRHGVYRTWYPDGSPYEHKHYVDGREEGRQQAWTDDGVLYLNYEMRAGRRYGFVNSRPCLPAAREL